VGKPVIEVNAQNQYRRKARWLLRPTRPLETFPGSGHRIEPMFSLGSPLFECHVAAVTYKPDRAGCGELAFK
jgi:hypothetical protein